MTSKNEVEWSGGHSTPAGNREALDPTVQRRGSASSP